MSTDSLVNEDFNADRFLIAFFFFVHRHLLVSPYIKHIAIQCHSGTDCGGFLVAAFSKSFHVQKSVFHDLMNHSCPSTTSFSLLETKCCWVAK